jgi:hypothetical protein
MNIYQKISEVMKNIEYLAKDDSVAFGTTKYKAISEEKVTTAVREQLVKQGIVIIPIKQESTNKELIRTEKSVNMLTEVHTTYRIQNIDDINDYIEVESNGTGVDTQDKGVGKAMTYAYKYMLLRTFAIPTGEDPDKISSAETDDRIQKELNKNELKLINATQIRTLQALIKTIPEAKAFYANILNTYRIADLSQLNSNQYGEILMEVKRVKGESYE